MKLKRLYRDLHKQLRNIGLLYVLQLSNQIFPIITMPMLLKNLGTSEYGVFQFALSISNYVFLIADYGFSLSLPRKISLIQKDKHQISQIYYTVQFIKIITTFILFFGVSVFFVVTDFFVEYELVTIVVFIYTFGLVLFPTWLFQGMERLSCSSIITFLFKVLQFGVLFIYFIEGKSIIVVACIYGILNLVQAMILDLLARKMFSITFFMPTRENIINAIKDGWYFFISQGATSLLGSINVIILGVFSTPYYVGIYSTAEKIVRAATNFVGPLSRAIYPSTCKRFKKSVEEGLKFINDIAILFTPIFLVGCIILYVKSYQISYIFTKESVSEVEMILKIMSLLPIFVLINNYAGTQIMTSLGYEKKLSKIIIISGILNIFLSVLLIPKYNAIGNSIATMIAEFVFMILTIIYAYQSLKTQGKKYE